MSKVAVAAILMLAILPIAIFIALYEAPPEAVPTLPEYTKNEPLELPQPPDPNDPKAGQCALCAVISDSGSKEQCLKDFDCEL